MEAISQRKPHKIVYGFNEAFLTFNSKLALNCSFLLVDDYSWFEKNEGGKGKAILIDPYDYETLHIVFDHDIDKYLEIIQIS